MKTGIELFSEERERQVNEEGFNEKHDLAYKNNELEDYAMFLLSGNPDYFPVGWDKKWKDKRFKRSRRDNIIKAGATLAAHLDATSVKLKKYVLITKSESGDSYTYFIHHPKNPSSDEINKFLLNYGNDKNDDSTRSYEYVASICEINDNDFITITKEN